MIPRRRGGEDVRVSEVLEQLNGILPHGARPTPDQHRCMLLSRDKILGLRPRKLTPQIHHQRMIRRHEIVPQRDCLLHGEALRKKRKQVLCRTYIRLVCLFLLAPPREAEDLVAGLEARSGWAGRDDGAGYAVTEDLRGGDEEVAVGLVEVEGAGGGPFDAEEDLVGGGGGGRHVEDFEGCVWVDGYDGRVGGHCGCVPAKGITVDGEERERGVEGGDMSGRGMCSDVRKDWENARPSALCVLNTTDLTSISGSWKLQRDVVTLRVSYKFRCEDLVTFIRARVVDRPQEERPSLTDAPETIQRIQHELFPIPTSQGGQSPQTVSGVRRKIAHAVRG